MSNLASSSTDITIIPESWTEDEVRFALDSRAQMSFTQIAGAINKTKGAVASLLRRYQVKLDPTSVKQRLTQGGQQAADRYAHDVLKFSPMKTVRVRGGRAVPQHMTEPAVGILNGVGVKLWELEANHCKWVVGEPKDLTCCGNERQNGSPYCSAHHSIAFKPRPAG